MGCERGSIRLLDDFLLVDGLPVNRFRQMKNPNLFHEINFWRKARTNHIRIRDLAVFFVCSPLHDVYYQYVNHRKRCFEKAVAGFRDLALTN